MARTRGKPKNVEKGPTYDRRTTRRSGRPSSLSSFSGRESMIETIPSDQEPSTSQSVDVTSPEMGRSAGFSLMGLHPNTNHYDASLKFGAFGPIDRQSDPSPKLEQRSGLNATYVVEQEDDHPIRRIITTDKRMSVDSLDEQPSLSPLPDIISNTSIESPKFSDDWNSDGTPDRTLDISNDEDLKEEGQLQAGDASKSGPALQQTSAMDIYYPIETRSTAVQTEGISLTVELERSMKEENARLARERNAYKRKLHDYKERLHKLERARILDRQKMAKRLGDAKGVLRQVVETIESAGNRYLELNDHDGSRRYTMSIEQFEHRRQSLIMVRKDWFRRLADLSDIEETMNRISSIGTINRLSRLSKVSNRLSYDVLSNRSAASQGHSRTMAGEEDKGDDHPVTFDGPSTSIGAGSFSHLDNRTSLGSRRESVGSLASISEDPREEATVERKEAKSVSQRRDAVTSNSEIEAEVNPAPRTKRKYTKKPKPVEPTESQLSTEDKENHEPPPSKPAPRKGAKGGTRKKKTAADTDAAPDAPAPEPAKPRGRGKGKTVNKNETQDETIQREDTSKMDEEEVIVPSGSRPRRAAATAATQRITRSNSTSSTATKSKKGKK